MSNVKADLYRRKLATALERADDEHFIQLCWAVDAIQSGRKERAKSYLRFSPEDATSEPGSGRLVYKWAIETLVNELLTTRKARLRGGPAKRLDCRKFGGIIPPFNALRNIENEEYGLFNNPDDVLQEMSRIGFRQFSWQREIFSVPNLARPLRLFGGPDAQVQFHSRYGISIQEFMLGGFAIWVQLREVPIITAPSAVKELGLTKDLFARVLSIISLPIEGMRTEAAKLRNNIKQPVAYKPSLLRRYPCISFENGARTRAPLVNLVLDLL